TEFAGISPVVCIGEPKLFSSRQHFRDINVRVGPTCIPDSPHQLGKYVDQKQTIKIDEGWLSLSRRFEKGKTRNTVALGPDPDLEEAFGRVGALRELQFGCAEAPRFPLDNQLANRNSWGGALRSNCSPQP